MDDSAVSEVLKEVLREVVPSREEREETNELCEKILRSFKRVAKGFAVKPMFCGSIAKDTWLAGNKDIDFFLLFRPTTMRDYLEKHGLAIGKEIIEDLGGEWEIAYAEHPYIRGFLGNHRIEIVPAYDVPDPGKIQSAVDRTPYHVKFVEKNLDKEIVNEVRLLKKFSKGIGVYGSDLKTEGFSGYLCELLIIEYGSFKNLLKSATKWNAGVVFDPAGHYKEKDMARKKFPNDPMVMIDPVDKNRNVASVLSAENFFLFIKKSKEFLQNPSKEFFFEGKNEPPEPEEIEDVMKRRETDFILVKFRSPVIHQDILWPQLRKLERRLVNALGDEDFHVVRSGSWSDGKKCIIVLELLSKKLPALRKRTGPSIFDVSGTKGFWRRYKGYNIFIEENNWVVEYPRKYTEATKLLEDFLKRGYEDLKEIGVPKELAKEIVDKVEIAEEWRVMRFVKMYTDFRRFLKNYFEKNLV